MAITPEWVLNSEGKFNDTSSANPVYLIVSTGAPDGAADPQASATKGTIYFRPSQTDDLSPVYVKIDSDSADDDWKQVMVDYSQDDYTRNGALTFLTDKSLYLRDTGQRIYSPAANTGALALAASGDTWQIGDQAGSNYIQVDFRGEATLEGTARFNPTGAFVIWDDFIYQVIDETTTPWVLNEGTDGAATDPAISVQEYGVVQLVTGAGDGSTAQDVSQLIGHVPVQADSTGLVMEARLHINTAITNVAVYVGFTDTTAREEPFSNAADVLTSNADDAVGFLYDTDATTDEWWMVATDSTVDDAGCAATGTAPVADIYQTFRIEVSADGATIAYYIDGALEGTLTGDTGVSPDVNLYPIVSACGDGTASKTIDLDYVWVSHNR